MSRICRITGKHPVIGNSRSRAMNKTKRLFLPNLHSRRLWFEKERRFITLRISVKGMRLIDKKGVGAVLSKLYPFKKKTKYFE